MTEGAVLGAELLMPEGELFAGEAIGVICRTSDGDLTVLDGHTPLVGDLVPGVVRIERAEATDAYLVHGGFLQVATERGAAVGILEGATKESRSTRVTLLVGVAERVGELEATRAEAARARAAEALGALGAPEDEGSRLEREQLERALARAELRLEAAGAASAQ
jgi:F-type H+-transporting ATPase subunit epsilon